MSSSSIEGRIHDNNSIVNTRPSNMSKENYEPALHARIENVSVSSSMEEITQVWIDLIKHQFRRKCRITDSVTDKTAYKVRMGYRNNGNCNMLTVSRAVEPYLDTDFLIVHVRNADRGQEGSDPGWAAAEQKLARDLYRVNEDLPKQNTPDLHGAIVFGPYVQFYRYKPDRTLANLMFERQKIMLHLTHDHSWLVSRLKSLRRAWYAFAEGENVPSEFDHYGIHTYGRPEDKPDVQQPYELPG